MAIEDLHDLAEQLHNFDEEHRNVVENQSIRITRRLAIDLVRHVDTLGQRIASLEEQLRSRS